MTADVIQFSDREIVALVALAALRGQRPNDDPIVHSAIGKALRLVDVKPISEGLVATGCRDFEIGSV